MPVTILNEIKQTIHFDAERATATRVVEIAGEDLEDFLDDLFGTTLVTGQGFSISKRANHPDYAWLRARDVRFECRPPEDPPHDAGARIYEVLRVTITYDAELIESEWPITADAPASYLTYTSDATAEVMTLPKHS